MKSYAVLVATTLVVVCLCNPTIPKNNAKRQIESQAVDNTTPCSLSVYRYLFNQPGTKIRPNLPTGTVIFGRALPPPDKAPNDQFQQAGSRIAPVNQYAPSGTSRAPFNQYKPAGSRQSPNDQYEQSGSRIDATELKPDKPENRGSSASASEPKLGYLPPNNNYLPPPSNPSVGNEFYPQPSNPGQANYFIPIGAVSVTPTPDTVNIGSTTTGSTDDAVIVSSTPTPEGLSTFQPEIPISSTLAPDFTGTGGSSSPDFSGVNGFPSLTPSPGYPTYSPTPSPEFPIYSPPPSAELPAGSPFYPPLSNPGLPAFPPSQTPGETVFASGNYPVGGVGGTRCACEDGRVFFTPNQNYPLAPGTPFDFSQTQLTNEIAGRQPQAFVSSTERPAPSLKPIVVGNLSPTYASSANENSIEYSFPTPIPSSSPAPISPSVFFSSNTPSPQISSVSTLYQATPSPPLGAFPSSTPHSDVNCLSSSKTLLKYPAPSQPAFRYPLPPLNQAPNFQYPAFQPAPLVHFPPPPAQQASFYKPVLKYPTPPQAYPAFPPVVRQPSLPSGNGYQYPKPSPSFPPPPSSTPAYEYPTPTTPSPPPPQPDSGYQYPKPSVPFPQPSESGDGYSYPKPKIAFGLPEKFNAYEAGKNDNLIVLKV